MTIQAGSRFGPYEVIAPLGAGGMGEVYRARDARLGREVALKVLPAAVASDESARRRFEREARAVAALSHPNILAIHDFGSEQQPAYAAMELLEGETLRARLSRGPLPWRKAAEIAAAIADGLAAAHGKGIVHRDLKPENVFLTSDGRVKILDFGLARSESVVSAEGATLSGVPLRRETDPGTVLGTVGYMAPEQVRGEMADARSDVFALGCVLYEMVTGARAFARPSAAETMAAIVNEDPPELPDSGTRCPPEVARVIGHCLEKNPEERFQSARDLAFDVRSLASHSAASLVPGRPRTRAGWTRWTAAALAAFAVFALGRLSRREPAIPPSPAVLALTSGATHDFAPAISPDGKFVAYLSDAGGRPGLWVKFVGGGPPADLSGKSGLEIQSNNVVGALEISPDGTGIAVRGGPPGTQTTLGWGVWIIPAPLGGPPRKILDRAAGPRWSPDGERLVFVRPLPIGGDAILTARADGQDESVLVPGADGVHLHQPAWSHDGAHVYFIRSIEGANGPPTEIWRVRSTGGAVERVVSTNGVALNPVATPDGRGLIYAGDPSGESPNLWWRPLAGGAERRLTTGAEEYVEPRLSRDGRRLVCTARRAFRSIAIIRADAAEQPHPPETLTGARSEDGEPSVCARTGQVVFSSIRNGVRNLWTLTAPGAEPRPLTSGPQVDRGPALSPDGSQVAFVSSRGGRRGIWLVPTAGGAPRKLVEADVLDRVSWAPDGRRLVYAASAGGIPGLWLVSADGGGATQIQGIRGRAPAWSPDADLIAYVSGDPPTGAVARFTTSTGQPALRQLGSSIPALSGYAWSHDGRRLVIAASPGSGTAELLVLDVREATLKSLGRLPGYLRLNGVAWSADDRSVLVGRIEYESRILLLDGLT